jgi:hypothetical protein
MQSVAVYESEGRPIHIPEDILTLLFSKGQSGHKGGARVPAWSFQIFVLLNPERAKQVFALLHVVGAWSKKVSV